MNKFWPSNKPFHLGNPMMEITTRDIGDIPGCPEAPRSGIYRPGSYRDAVTECAVRANNYATDVKLHIAGHLGKDQVFRAFNAPIYGAHGEKL